MRADKLRTLPNSAEEGQSNLRMSMHGDDDIRLLVLEYCCTDLVKSSQTENAESSPGTTKNVRARTYFLPIAADTPPIQLWTQLLAILRADAGEKYMYSEDIRRR